ncbi:NADH-quinone oxidoreductase subunit NuoN [Candidatus Symbiobacter mobilis]|uniref:NADH-quinone oxidoreductase subunit N n=1 Tax=Candidatus Symbiobacter mobilis CR TaxID=946483 RepID=U5N887_9BURK|nr:NADH-quinone oxidoreductase subunit NuoN [Candidatus Symbiobacter mobilis]AGX87776.1 NADH dehydrogenase I subunit N [Candidatus Symbiobacter mobilis CR]
MIDELSLLVVFPELLLLVMACAVAIYDLYGNGKDRGETFALTMLTLAGIAAIQANDALAGRTLYAFGDMVVSDKLGNWLKCFSTLSVMVTLVYARPYIGERGMLRSGGEFYLFSLFALLGMSVMISANHLLVVYLGIELLTLTSYALVASRRDDPVGTEAAMKYFVLGALGSGLLLYGMSMLYGATGSLHLGEVLHAINSGQIQHTVLVFGLVFLVSGLAFKLGAAPFHMWIPDVYHGAPTAVTLLIAGAPKLAAFAVALRVLVEGMHGLAMEWQQMLAVLAVLSLAVGNFAAIMQTNLKRMLAYSTISHMGFVVLGLLSGGLGNDHALAESAYGAAMFYAISYVLTTLVGFGVILALACKDKESDTLQDFVGLNQRSPFLAAAMALCMFSLAGVPPMLGFYAKLAVLQVLLASGGTPYLMLAIFAVLMSLVGAFYYLRVVKVMYFDAPGTTAAPHSCGIDVRLVLSANAALLLLVGLLPGALLTLCQDAVAGILVG